MSDDLASYLASQITGLTAGRNLFVSNYPKDKKNIVVLNDTGGTSSNVDYAIDEFTVQVDLRYERKSYVACMAMANDIYKRLVRKEYLTIGTKNVMLVTAINKPQHIGLDERNRHYVTVNFNFKVRDYHGEEV